MSAIPDVFTCPPGTHGGFHCEHWSLSAEACCYCGGAEDSDDDPCRPTLSQQD
jgi:hypothetical protein